MASTPREIRFFNSLGRRSETFRPLEPGKVRLYTCGPTVYSHVHIGNHRTFLFEDLLRRSLLFLGYEVDHVMNLTDVDDKTIRGAAERGVGLDEFTAEYVESFFADLDTLHLQRAERYPRATEHIPEMIELTEKLLRNGHAYVAEDGSVFFRIASDEDYGRLSGVDPEKVRRGERVANDEYGKEDVRDFVLWKAAKDGEPAWDSPWGPGRPGWHVECSAMGMKYLGESFDIHCGGVDNMFPHHENEIAQSESATGQTFVHTWLHSEHLIVDGAKMSKSLGNQYTLEDLLEMEADPRALRYLFVSTHYRQKLNFTFESLKAAGAALRRVDEMRFRLESCEDSGEGSPEMAAAAEELVEGFAAALAEDLNISVALSAVFLFVKKVNKAVEEGAIGRGGRQLLLDALARVNSVLGVLDPAEWRRDTAGKGPSDEEIEQRLAERREARAKRDFATSDRIRDELLEAGVVIEDTPHQGTRWRRG